MKKVLVLLLFSLLACTQSQVTNFEQVDSVVEQAIQDSVFPGATVYVGSKDGKIFENHYGNFTYSNDSKTVDKHSIYDLASVTKVFATTFSVMKLYDEGLIDIEEFVWKYLPEFKQNGKDTIRIRDLLTHESGLQAYYRPAEDDTRNFLLDTIKALPCSYETNSKSVYSCLNFVTLMMVVEQVSGKTLDEFYREKFIEPLNLERTMYKPSDKIKEYCLPTENGLQGIVHDPLARSLDGVSGNAGLFSDAEGLSKLCTILLNDGKYEDKEIFKASTVKKFIKRQSDISTRALGFDTRSEKHSTAGKYFSMGSYGHLGYTGTSVWIDPVREIFVIFLTNRVYPDDSAHVNDARRNVHDAVIKSLEM